VAPADQDQDYAFGRPSLTRAKLRRLELQAGAPRLARRHTGQRVGATAAEKDLERERQLAGERAYVRAIAEATPRRRRSTSNESSAQPAGRSSTTGS
jgi:hypothetical protein